MLTAFSEKQTKGQTVCNLSVPWPTALWGLLKERHGVGLTLSLSLSKPVFRSQNKEANHHVVVFILTVNWLAQIFASAGVFMVC